MERGERQRHWQAGNHTEIRNIDGQQLLFSVSLLISMSVSLSINSVSESFLLSSPILLFLFFSCPLFISLCTLSLSVRLSLPFFLFCCPSYHSPLSFEFFFSMIHIDICPTGHASCDVFQHCGYHLLLLRGHASRCQGHRSFLVFLPGHISSRVPHRRWQYLCWQCKFKYSHFVALLFFSFLKYGYNSMIKMENG